MAKTYKVEWIQQAKMDLQDILAYLQPQMSQHNLQKFHRQIIACTRFLPNFPNLYPVVPKYCAG